MECFWNFSDFMSKELICHHQKFMIEIGNSTLVTYLQVPPKLEESWEFRVSGNGEVWSDGIWTSGGEGDMPNNHKCKRYYSWLRKS